MHPVGYSAADLHQKVTQNRSLLMRLIIFLTLLGLSACADTCTHGYGPAQAYSVACAK